MNLLSFYLCSEEKVFFWKSQNSCDSIFCRCELDFSQITTAINVGICHVPPWIRRVGYWACKVDNIRDGIHTHLVTLIGTVLKLDGWSFICFFVFFSNCCLAVPQPTLDHSQGDSLTNLMLITAFVHVQPKGHWEPHNKVGSLSPT